MSDNGQHAAEQAAFYERGRHAHLRANEADFYARKLTARLVEQAGIREHHTVLELGAGFGRFTFCLLEHCGSVIALDLTQRCLDELESVRGARGIAPERCRVHCGNVTELGEADLGQEIDFVVGFFFLHHLPGFPAVLKRLAGFVKPGGGMAFLEPNRRNPLFLLQIMCCPDMSWREERGMFRLSAREVEAGYRAADLSEVSTSTFGFFPPQVLNRVAAARSIEERLERVGFLRPLLPFLLMSARRSSA